MKTSLIAILVSTLTGTLQAAVDRDPNGLSDIFEYAYFKGAADPLGDPDGDGVSNFDEMIWGTNPMDAASKVTGPAVTVVDGGIRLNWPAAPNRTYELLGSRDFQTWESVASGVISSHTEPSEGPNASPFRFFRLLVTLDPRDTNGDGLADWEEALWVQAFGKAINLTDLDGDGLLDSQEFQLGRDPGKKDHPATGLVLFTPLEK